MTLRAKNEVVGFRYGRCGRAAGQLRKPRVCPRMAVVVLDDLERTQEELRTRQEKWLKEQEILQKEVLDHRSAEQHLQSECGELKDWLSVAEKKLELAEEASRQSDIHHQETLAALELKLRERGESLDLLNVQLDSRADEAERDIKAAKEKASALEGSLREEQKRSRDLEKQLEQLRSEGDDRPARAVLTCQWEPIRDVRFAAGSPS